MNDQLDRNFHEIFHLLLKDWAIRFPERNQVLHWEGILKQWIENDKLPLLARTSSALRGDSLMNTHNLKVIVSDNTPAHWVFCKIVFGKELPDLNHVRELWNTSSFPLALMLKREEKDKGFLTIKNTSK
jgi:hypothetical protein